MANGTVGLSVTNVQLDYAVTLTCWDMKRGSASFRLEEAFDLVEATGRVTRIDPEHIGSGAILVAALHTATVEGVDVDSEGALRLTFADGRSIRAEPDPAFESWSYVDGHNGRVICMPGGGLAVWSPEVTT